MKVFWQQCEGQTIDGFPLLQYLGGGEDHAVFLTEHGQGTPQRAAIKLLHADPETTESQLRQWRVSAELSHPNLVRLFERGRWQLNEVPLLYVVMEFADEDLSQVIPHRPLTIQEARQMLDPALSALAYLHAKGFVHGRLKPSNCMAVADQLKLSSDAVSESGTGQIAPPGDMWSLGMILVECLTGQLPVSSQDQQQDPALPESTPVEFREIARNLLRRDPHSRWTVEQVRERLRGGPVRTRNRLYAAAAVVALLALAMLGGTLLVRRAPSGMPQAQPLPTPAPRPQRPPETTAAAPQPAPQPSTPPPAAPPPSDPPPAPARSLPRSSPDEIVQQVMPQVLPRARNGIHGKVALSVRLDVDPSGNVTAAALESPGPSEYFAGLALKSAQRWKFAPAGAASVWVLHFQFTRAGTKVAPSKGAP